MTDPGTISTTVAMDRGERLVVWVGFPAVGAAAGWALLLTAGWLASAPVVPFRLAFRWLDGPGPWPSAVALSAGVLAGLALAGAAVHESLEVRVTGSAVLLLREGRTQRLERAQVATAFVDGKDLVLVDRAGAELARERTDLARVRLQEAFAAHGYPWHHGGDPRAAEFRRWVAGAPDLPPGAAGLLAARARALAARRPDDVRDLRTELAGLGVVVRDERGKQFWRVVR